MIFENIKGKLGFGCMRLPMINDEVDYNEFSDMIDLFLKEGFNYFDTAHGYLDGKSETALRECLVKRHKREDFILADKLSYWTFEREEDILPLFEKQLKQCGVDYFDVYLFHCMNHNGYEKHKKCNSFEIVKKLKEQGKIKHIAMSFHDSAEYLDKILTEQPFMEAVQLQFNYLDFDDPTIESKACYDVCVKHSKKVLVMEPVRGGALVNLPKRAEDIIKAKSDNTPAKLALRFAASFPDIFMILSGMGNMDMIKENTNTFNNLTPLSDDELAMTDEIRKIIRETRKIPCTKCNYCFENCIKKIPVSDIFYIFNEYLGAQISKTEYSSKIKPYVEKLNSCIKCGKCETNCPQMIKIRDEFEKVSKNIKVAF